VARPQRRRRGALVAEDPGGAAVDGQGLAEGCQRLHPRLGLAPEDDGHGLVYDERAGTWHGAKVPPHRGSLAIASCQRGRYRRILVSLILHTATGGRSIGHNAAIAVGSTVAPLGLFASPISGSSMNPARTLGPDIVGANFTGWWVYVFGDLIGAAIAVVIIILVRGFSVQEETEAAEGGALPR
jgi:hypothetical protein